MCWKVISDILFQFVILIWSPDQPLIRFSMFEKKSCQILDVGQKSPGEPSECPGGLKSKNVIIWCLKPFGSVQIDAFSYRSRYYTTSRSEVRRPKKNLDFFNSLLFSLLLALNGSTEGIKWRRHGRFWATWGPCVMTP